MRRTIAVLAALGLMLVLGAPQALAANGPKDKPPKKDNDTYVQLLAINDLHGHLAPNTPGTIQTGCCNPVNNSSGVQTGWAAKTVPAGGIEYLATHIKQLREENSNTITVGAGDLIGASPLVSALFHDEPAIEAMNALQLDVSGVGNHEFDEGVPELLRMQNGGCHPVDGCQDGDGVRRRGLPVPRGERVLRGHRSDDPAGVRGEEDRQRQDRVHRPDARGHADDRDAVGRGGPRVPAGGRDRQRAGREAPQRAGRQGVRRPPAPGRLPEPAGGARVPRAGESGCLRGRQQVRRASAAARSRRSPTASTRASRSSISAHTHQPYICQIGGKLVTSAASFGRLVTDIDLRIDHQSKQIVSAEAKNVIVTQDVAKDRGRDGDPQPSTRRSSAPLANQVVGTITADIRSGRDTPAGRTRRRAADGRRDRRRDARGDRPDRLRRRGGGVHEHRRRPRGRCSSTRPAVASSPGRGHVRRGVHRPAVRQHARRQDVLGPGDLRRARAAVQQPGRGPEPDHARVGQRPLPVERDDDSADRRRIRDVQANVAINKAAELPGGHEQLHGRRRRRLHGLPRPVHPAARRQRRPRRVRRIPREAPPASRLRR